MTNEQFINYVENHYDYDDLVETNEDALDEWYKKAEKDFNKNNKSTVALDSVYSDKVTNVQANNQEYYNITRNQISRANTIQDLPQIDDRYSSNTVNNLNQAYQNRIDFINERLEPRREEAFNLTYDDVQGSRFGRSIRSGRVTNEFNDFYGLNDEEGEFVQNRLNQEYIQEQIQEENE